jgi:DNA-binding LacI/PurR family transcriptional regulator
VTFPVDLQIEKPTPSYAQLVEALRGAIARRTIAPGTRLPDERELARQFSLSRGTVRRALAELEATGLLSRQQGRGTFVTDERTTPAIPLTAVLNNAALASGQGFSAHVVQGMVETAAARGAQLALRDGSTMMARNVIEPAAEIFVCPLDSKVVKAAAKSRPVVSVDYAISGARIDSVVYDNRLGATQAVRHLIAAGHRRIACIDAKLERQGKLLDEPTATERTAGYCDAMSAAGLAPILWPMSMDTRDVRREIPARFKSAPPPTAIFAFDEAVALGIWMALSELGLRIPRDVSVTCFRCAETPQAGGIDWSSIRVSAKEMGKAAVEAALARIKSPSDNKETGRTIVIPHQWSDGESCSRSK